jgi:cell division protein FtsB
MPLVDRVLRGPVWIAMLGVLLAGIVFLNVSVLELNRGIARTDAQSATLERTNSGLRERVARLDSGERIQQLAAARGFVMPQPGDVTYVRPHASDAKLALQRITPPSGASTTATTPAATTTTQTGYTPGGGAVTGTGTTGTSTGSGTGTTGTGTSTGTGTTGTGMATRVAPTSAVTPAAPTAPATTQAP